MDSKEMIITEYEWVSVTDSRQCLEGMNLTPLRVVGKVSKICNCDKCRAVYLNISVAEMRRRDLIRLHSATVIQQRLLRWTRRLAIQHEDDQYELL